MDHHIEKTLDIKLNEKEARSLRDIINKLSSDETLQIIEDLDEALLWFLNDINGVR